jgi:hypothetical protein
MGWWNSGKDGSSLEFRSDNHYWGDGPADVMDAALDNIRQQFRSEWGREPSLSELLAGVKFSAGIMELSECD